MLTQQLVIFGIVLPIAISAVVMMIAWRPWRKPPGAFSIGNRGGWGGALAVGAAYIVAHIGIHSWPVFVPTEAQHAVFWAAVLGVLVGLFGARFRQRIILCAAGRFFGMFGIIWLVMRWKMILGQWSMGELILWVTIGAVAGALCWTGAVHLGRDVEGDALEVDGTDDAPGRGGFDTPFVLAGVAGLGANLIILNGHNQSMGESTGALSLALLACALMCLWRPGMTVARGAAPVASLVLFMSLIDACLRSDLGYGYAMTIAMAPLMALAGARLVPADAHNVVRTVARVLGAAIPLGVLFAIELAKFLAEQAEAAELGY